MECSSDLQDLLTNLATQSKICKLWIDGLIKPVFLMMLYVRAERERGEWPLHLHAASAFIYYKRIVSYQTITYYV